MIGSSSLQKSSSRLPFGWLYFEAAKFWCLMNPIQWPESVGDAWKGNRVCDQTSPASFSTIFFVSSSFSSFCLFISFAFLLGFPSTWIKAAACIALLFLVIIMIMIVQSAVVELWRDRMPSPDSLVLSLFLSLGLFMPKHWASSAVHFLLCLQWKVFFSLFFEKKIKMRQRKETRNGWDGDSE